MGNVGGSSNPDPAISGTSSQLVAGSQARPERWCRCAGAATGRAVGEDAEVPPSLDLGLERRGVARVTEPRGDMVVASDSLHLTVDGG